MVTTLRLESRGGVTRVFDATTGEEIRHVTSLELMQVPPGPLFAVVKLVATIVEADLEARAEFHLLDYHEGHMTDHAIDQLEHYRTLPNGNSLRRTPDHRRIYLFGPGGNLMGEVIPGSLACQLLNLGTEDYGVLPGDPGASIIGPGPTPLEPPPKRQPFPWYRRALDRLRGR